MRTLEELVPKLLAKTADGSLDWSQGNDASTFHAKIGQYVIAVWSWFNTDDGSEGNAIAIKPIEAQNYSDVVLADKYAPKHEKLEELYGYARRSALKVDRMIIQVDKDLDDLFPF